jgi:hypothetical protein
MKCLDPMLAPLSPSSLLVLVLALAGCSDDGLAPAGGTDAESTAGTGGSVTGGETGPSNGTTSAQEGGSSSPSDDSTGGGTTGSGDGSDSGTTGGTPPMTCEMSDECVLINDCCRCAAAHVDDVIPECPMKCIQPTCDALGIPDIGVVCEDGQCELEPRDCSGVVTCDSPMPECPEGTLPEVGPDNSCWTGACVPVDVCDSVPGCEHCDADEACVETQAQLGTSYACRDVPEACDGVPSCACMPDDTCMAPFDLCADADGLIQCSCPAC